VTGPPTPPPSAAASTPIPRVPISDSAITVPADVIATLLAFHAKSPDIRSQPADGYRKESLEILSGKETQ